jgi:predicted flap endonuclease-1-like 5' DNA nuclease
MAMGYPIEEIEGIGPAFGDKLRAAGIKDTDGLLAKTGTPKDRTALAAATGIAEALVLKWANRADLMRVKGIGEQFSDLLEMAGVDTVPELAKRNAENLHAALLAANEAKKLVRQPPSLKVVQDWIAAAKDLPRALHY